jgi:hypothetical protein
MHKYIILFFSLTLIFSACTPGKSGTDIIKHDQMVSLLTDLHIIDGSMYNVVSQNPDTLYKYGTGKYLALFKRYHVDSAQFRRSLNYYADKPVELEKIYDLVLARIKEKTDSINKKLLKNPNALRPI